MAKKKERSVNVSGKPKHSLDVNRDGSSSSKTKGGRSSATVRRLKMYNSRPKRDSKGQIVKHDLQSKELPSTRIQPDRRWFGNDFDFIFCIGLINCNNFQLVRISMVNFLIFFLKLSNREY